MKTKKYFCIHMAAIAAVFSIFTPAANAQFFSTPNSGANGVGHSVFFINADTGYVGGEDNSKGVIQKTTDGGQTWSRVYTSSTTLEWVYDIFFVNATIGFAAGENGTILRTVDGGSNWTIQSISGVFLFNAVFFPTQSIGYAVGDGLPEGPIYKTTDGGTSWTAQTSGAISFLNDVFFLNADTGYAVGDYEVLKTINGGSSWTNVSPSSNNFEHTSVFCTDASTCYLGGAGIKKTSDGGTTWNALSLPVLTAPDIYYSSSLHFTDAQTGYAIAVEYDTTTSSFSNGTILKTTSAGQSWLNINTSANNDTLQSRPMSSVYFPNSQTGYITGFKGTMLKTTNAGGIISGIEGIKENAIEMNIYPNPSDGNCTITFPETSGQIQLINSIGQIVQTKIINKESRAQFQINANGIYFIHVMQDSKMIMRTKLVITD